MGRTGQSQPSFLEQPYLAHTALRPRAGLQFCPYEDVLGGGGTVGASPACWSLVSLGRAGPPSGDLRDGGSLWARTLRQLGHRAPSGWSGFCYSSMCPPLPPGAANPTSMAWRVTHTGAGGLAAGVGGEGAAREGEGPAPPWAGAGVLGREGFSGASAFRPSLVSPSCGSLPSLFFVLHPGARRAHLSRSTSLAEVDVISLEQAKKGTEAERLVQSRVPGGLGAPHPASRPPRPQQPLPASGGCCSFHSPPLPQGYDPDTGLPSSQSQKQKGRSSTASLVKGRGRSWIRSTG